MANKEITLINITNQEQLPMRAVDNGDGTYSYSVSLTDLVDGALRVALNSEDADNQVLQVSRTKTPTSVVTSSSALYTGPIKLNAIVAANNHASNDVTLSIYDGTNSSGTKVVVDITVPPKGVVQLKDLDILCSVGVYASISGSGTPSVMALLEAH
jgi:hypothetical protein